MCKDITTTNPPPLEMQDSGYHCLKDLVCGNVDKLMVETGVTQCGSPLNDLSEEVLDIVCVVANYLQLSEGSPNFPEFTGFTSEFETNLELYDNSDEWSNSDSNWRKRIIDNVNRTRSMPDVADMPGSGRN